MDKLLFGTAGIPLCTSPRNTIEGIKAVRRLGLGAMEIEFVRSVHIAAEKAPEIRKTAGVEDVTLTCHAPYYINLNAQDPAIVAASRQRILNSARILSICGGWSVALHAGYYMKQEPANVTERMAEQLRIITKTLRDEGREAWIRPEYGGRLGSWGALDELIAVAQAVDGVLPCIDFGHVVARSMGKENGYEHFAKVLAGLERGLGKEILRNMHIHCEGISWGASGEKSHVNLADSPLRYQELMKALKDFSVHGVLISESPNIEADALLMEKAHRSS